MIFIFFTTACFGWPPRLLQNRQNTTYNIQEHISNIVQDNGKQNKFRRDDTIVQQLERQFKTQLKLKYSATSLPPNPPVGFKRAPTKSYPGPSPCCDPELP
jgi:hypothetical protein